MDFEILYEDKYLILANKPCGVISQDSEGECFPKMIKEKLSLDYLGVVHRLDTTTSGIIMYSKDKKYTGKLSVNNLGWQIVSLPAEMVVYCGAMCVVLITPTQLLRWASVTYRSKRGLRS